MTIIIAAGAGLIYIIIGTFFMIIAGMALNPESQSNPSGLPNWANVTIQMLAGLFWPFSLIGLIGKFIYNKFA